MKHGGDGGQIARRSNEHQPHRGRFRTHALNRAIVDNEEYLTRPILRDQALQEAQKRAAIADLGE
jgi:hypothetical protein